MDIKTVYRRHEYFIRVYDEKASEADRTNYANSWKGCAIVTGMINEKLQEVSELDGRVIVTADLTLEDILKRLKSKGIDVQLKIVRKYVTTLSKNTSFIYKLGTYESIPR